MSLSYVVNKLDLAGKDEVKQLQKELEAYRTLITFYEQRVFECELRLSKAEETIQLLARQLNKPIYILGSTKETEENT